MTTTSQDLNQMTLSDPDRVCNGHNGIAPDGADSGSNHRGCDRRYRHHVALLGLSIAVVNCYAQATFCIAIVEMVLPPDYVDQSKSSSSLTNGTEQVASFRLPDNSCPIEYKYRDYYDSWRFPVNSTLESLPQANSLNIDISNRFDWDASSQGLLLGAFAVGTAPLQVLGGRLAEIYGAKWVLLVSCVGTALTNLTIPWLAHFSFVLLILNRILMGIAQAGMEPGLMCLLAKWLTPSETGFFISMLLFAICIGFFLGSLGSSFLLSMGYSWPITYYAAGSMNLVVAVVWLLYASSTPNESKLISAEELDYINSEQSGQRQQESSDEHNECVTQGAGHSQCDELTGQPKLMANNIEDPAPWAEILSTRSVWAFIICKISIRWCADVLGIELPTYLANVLHLSIKLNGFMNSVSSALFAIFSFLTGYLVSELLDHQQKQLALRQQQERILMTPNKSPDLLVGRTIVTTLGHKVSNGNQISKTNLRKLFQSMASFGSAISMFLMTYYDCHIIFSMSMLLILSSCLVMGTGGELQIPYDMTSKYPGTLHGMACTLSVSGWLAPPLIGLILGDQPSSRYRWSIVWYSTAAITFIGGLVFVLFADASPQDFDKRRQVAISKNNTRQRRKSSPAILGQLAVDLEQPVWCTQQFDGRPMKIRQVAGSYVKPLYLNTHSSMAIPTTIYPYNIDPPFGKLDQVNGSSSNWKRPQVKGNRLSILWRPRLFRRRKGKLSLASRGDMTN